MDILGHILVPVLEGPGEGGMYLDIADELFHSICAPVTSKVFLLCIEFVVLNSVTSNA